MHPTPTVSLERVLKDFGPAPEDATLDGRRGGLCVHWARFNQLPNSFLSWPIPDRVSGSFAERQVAGRQRRQYCGFNNYVLHVYPDSVAWVLRSPFEF